MSKNMKIDNIELRMTSIACPEQYEAFDINGKQVGYLRLRHGHFRVDFLDCGEEIIYEAEPAGDGCFYSEERDFYLQKAVKVIKNKIEERNATNPKVGDIIKLGNKRWHVKRELPDVDKKDND